MDHLRRLVSAPACLLLAFLLSAPHPALAAEEADVAEVFSALDDRWARLEAYECEYDQSSSWAGRSQEFRGRYLFAKPNRVRVEILEGDGAGTVLLWDGGSSVRVRKKGLLSLLPLRLDLRSRWLLDPFGQDLSASTWGFLMEQGRAGLREGRLQLLGKEAWEGAAAWVLRNRYPPGKGSFAEDLVYVDAEHLQPLRVVRKDSGGCVVQEIRYRKVRIDPPVPPAAFTSF